MNCRKIEQKNSKMVKSEMIFKMIFKTLFKTIKDKTLCLFSIIDN